MKKVVACEPCVFVILSSCKHPFHPYDACLIMVQTSHGITSFPSIAKDQVVNTEPLESICGP